MLSADERTLTCTAQARPATIPGTAEIGRLAGLGSDFYVGVSGYGVYKIAFDDITGVKW